MYGKRLKTDGSRQEAEIVSKMSPQPNLRRFYVVCSTLFFSSFSDFGSVLQMRISSEAYALLRWNAKNAPPLYPLIPLTLIVFSFLATLKNVMEGRRAKHACVFAIDFDSCSSH